MSKRKKTEKQKDFAKKKLKLGKTAAKPDNHTDTSFVAKTISLPNQSIAQKASNSSKSRNNQEVDLTHQIQLVKHHSPQTRTEVLGFIEKHLPENPSMYKPLMTAIIPLIVDLSTNVRNGLISLLTAAAQASPGLLDLHIKAIVLFIHSAMTHIQSDIRNSSSKFIQILVKHSPNSLVKGHFVKTLKCYFSLLSWPLKDDKKSISLAITTSASTGGATKKARIHHLNILKQFLEVALFQNSRDTASIINAANTLMIHPLSGKYLLPTVSGQFVPYKLFVKELSSREMESTSPGEVDDGRLTLADLTTFSTDDLTSRKRAFIDVFMVPMQTNLKNLMKEGGEVGREAKNLWDLIARVSEDQESTSK